ncbi:MAG: hypothetical protein H6621_03050 [Halobacteriovoraceae bacterium]|nr:hypothetical protein [Halobacteriovoraceae bacterium]MCB9094023.1 hypothetical protein [Halobacteriovoraceae bacterium]
MKIFLVTSEVTYIPENYQGLFEQLLLKYSGDIAGIIILKNFEFSLLAKSLSLYLLGANNVGSSLLKNVFELPMKRREKLFQYYGIPCYKFKDINSNECLEFLRSESPDLIVNMRTRYIYKKAVLEIPKLGCLNIHHGLLPQYRGTMCDLYALSENREAGFTIHEMTAKVDAGAILKRVVVDSEGTEKNYLKYLYRASLLEGQVLADLLEEIVKKKGLTQKVENGGSPVVYTRNPSAKRIYEMLDSGMVL